MLPHPRAAGPQPAISSSGRQSCSHGQTAVECRDKRRGWVSDDRCLGPRERECGVVSAPEALAKVSRPLLPRPPWPRPLAKATGPGGAGRTRCKCFRHTGVARAGAQLHNNGVAPWTRRGRGALGTWSWPPPRPCPPSCPGLPTTPSRPKCRPPPVAAAGGLRYPCALLACPAMPPPLATSRAPGYFAWSLYLEGEANV